MTVKEAFKIGFIRELSEKGIAPDAIDSVIVKQSAGLGLININEDITDEVGKGLGLVSKMLAVPALGLPFYLGWQMAKTKRINPTDVKALSDIDLIKEYSSGTHALARKQRKKKGKK